VRRFWITFAAACVSGGLLWLAMALGAVGFEARKAGLHEGRLQGLLEKQPRVEAVTQAFENEGTLLLGTASGRQAIRTLARVHAGASAGAVLQRGGDLPYARAFRAGDVVYFIFFDADGVMRAYAWARYP
jgi:hypothetical protein